ncbi:MAG: permease-like cell division protein FtsX [Tissierellia bacterium]|nr:permease-like cell division protein FtsX [Tissierellia bacterium]
MRTLRQFKNILKEAVKGLWRNKAMGTASIISITAVLLIFGIVLLMILNVNKIVFDAGTKLDKVVLFLEDEVTEQQKDDLIGTIETNKKVKSVSFTSKEEALEEYKKSFEDEEYIFEGLPGNPLPASLTVEVENLEDANQVVNEVKDFPGVYKVQYFDEVVEKMIKISKGVQIGGGLVVFILIFVAIVLIHNTIKIALTNRHREIQIMKYVGAKNQYISGPFLLEGMFFGLIGALLGLGILYFVYGQLFQKANLQMVNIIGSEFISPYLIFTDLIIIFACLGIGIGYLGSVISVSRFLDV